MFALGTQFSLSSLRRYLGLTILGASVQVALTVGLTMLIGWAFNYSLQQAALFGIFISMSSTIVLVKVFGDRNETNTIHGKAALSIALGQDLLSLPVIVLLPFLTGSLQEAVAPMATSIAKVAGIIVVSYLIGLRVLPWVLDRVANYGRELFLLSVVLIAIGVAVLIDRLGVSFILGAFIAGLVVADSRYGKQILTETIPLRDIFAPFFFVSVGMLLDLGFVGANAVLVALAVLYVIAAKFLVVTVLVLLFRYTLRSSLLAAAALAQVGEFSFVLAQIGLLQQAIDHDLYSLVIACALISLFASPLVITLTYRVIRLMERLAVLKRPVREALPDGRADITPGSP